jgi:phage tail sheath gpL-like
MPISFNLIPNLLRPPGAYIEYDASRAVSGLAVLPNRVVIIGSRLSTGSVAALTPVQITRETDGKTFFGTGSQLARMCKAFKKASKFTEVWAIGVADDGGGVAAQKTLTVTGPATSSGTLYIWVHGERVPVAVADGDDANTIAASIEAALAIAEPEKDLMVTFGVATNVVTGTCRHAAAFGEDLDIRVNYELTPQERDALPAGVSVAVANTVVGSGNPDIGTALAVVGDEFFTKYVSGYSDATNVAALEAELEDRWGPLAQQDAVGYVGITGTHSDLTTYGGARNSQFSCAMGSGGVAVGSPTPEAEWAAVVAAVDSNEPDPARPRQSLPLPGVLPPAKADRFTLTERNLLLQTGISTYTVDQAGKVYIERLITTYQTNAQAVPDTTFLNVETMHTLAALRFTLRSRITTKYPRHKLADDGTNYGPGQAIVTPRIIRAEILSLFGQWELNGWVEDFEQFAEELIVERNASDRDRLDARLGPNLINQFRVFAGQIQFIV